MWLFEQGISYLDKHAGAFSVLLTLGLVTSNLIFVYVTREILQENRRLRKAQTEPKLVIYPKPHERHINVLNVIVANVGAGPAMNVHASIISGQHSLQENGVTWAHRFPADGFSIIPQGEKMEFFLETGPNLLSEPKLEPFDVEIGCTDLNDNSHGPWRYKVDISVLEGLTKVGKDPQESMANSLEKIASSFHKLQR